MIRKEMIAMLLAGGQGSRLGVLTSSIAKPAVTFGGKYRIIDFPLSNCINSGVDTVGVLTQYQPLRLNTHIGIGIPWDLDRNVGGVSVLPPYEKSTNSEWYTGTANAIYQNLKYMEQFNPEYVLILGGDHIYKMDYQKMLEDHIKNDADCTIAVLEVSLEEASRFGIMNTDENNRIVEFEEKPAKPKSTKASMGIYIFKREKLFSYLRSDALDPASSNDFGKNIIPNMLNAGEKMMAYPFKGYWKDVGTISSLWEANQDLLGEAPEFDIYDSQWKIYSRNMGIEPQFIADGAVVSNSLITSGAKIYGTVINSVIGASVVVEKGAVVKDSVIFADSVISSGATVNYSILDEEVVIGEECVVGSPKGDGVEIAVVGRGCVVTSKSVVTAGANIEKEDK